MKSLLWGGIFLILFATASTTPSYTWTQKASAGVGRMAATLADLGESVFLHGGALGTSVENTFGNVLSDMYIYHITNNTWAPYRNPQGLPPSARWGHSSVTYDNQILIYGGSIFPTDTASLSGWYSITPDWACPAIGDYLPESYLKSPADTRWCVKVTGRTAGFIWGDNPKYGWHSSISTAAVHAGALAPGETGVIYVEKIAYSGTFTSVYRNGITSYETEFDSPAFRVIAAGSCATPLESGIMGQNSDLGLSFYNHQNRKSFVAQLTGKLTALNDVTLLTLEGGDQFIPIGAIAWNNSAGLVGFAPGLCANSITDASGDTASVDYCAINATNPTLLVTLAAVYEVTSLLIYPRATLYSQFPNGVNVSVWIDGRNITAKPVNLTLPYTSIRLPNAGFSHNLQLRFTGVALNQIFALSEVQVFGQPQLTLHKARNLTMSSIRTNVSIPTRWPAWCTDGKSASNDQMCGTHIQMNPWIEMDLGLVRPIDLLTISFSEADMPSALTILQTMEVYFGNTPGTGGSSNTRCFNGQTDAAKIIQLNHVAYPNSYSVPCPTPASRFVTLRIASEIPAEIRLVELAAMIKEPSNERSYSLYSKDTPLSAAAVHSGALDIGETGYVRITIRGPVSGFSSTPGRGRLSTSTESTSASGLSYSIAAASPGLCRVTTGTSPGQRVSHAAFVRNGKMYIWGGATAINTDSTITASDDALYSLDLTTMHWESTLLANSPTSRIGFAYAYSNDRFVVYGGTGRVNPANMAFGDMYMLDFSTATPTWVTLPCADICSPRSFASAVIINDVFVAFGGVGQDGVEVSSLITMDLAAKVWNSSYFIVSFMPRRMLSTTVVTIHATSETCESSTTAFIYGGYKYIDGDLNLEQSYLAELWALTPFPKDFWAARTSMSFVDGSFAGMYRDLNVDVTLDECGNGVFSGGKIEFTAPAGFTLTRMGAESTTAPWRAIISTDAKETQNVLTITGAHRIFVASGNRVIIDTGVNLLQNGGAEEPLNSSIWEPDTNAVWSRATPASAHLSPVPDAMFGYGWFQSNSSTTTSTLTQKAFLLSNQSTYHLRAFTTATSALTGSITVQFYADGCINGNTIQGTFEFAPSLTGLSWNMITGTMTKPALAICANVILNSANQVAFDEVFFGYYPLNDIRLGSTLHVRLSGIKIPISCEASSSWIFGMKTYKYYDGDGFGSDLASSNVSPSSPCIDQCHNCNYRETNSQNVRVYECRWPSTRDGKIMFYERSSIDMEMATMQTTCSNCQPSGAQCNGF